MNEAQAYQAIYGELVYSVPHYHKRTHFEPMDLDLKPGGVNRIDYNRVSISTKSGEIIVRTQKPVEMFD